MSKEKFPLLGSASSEEHLAMDHDAPAADRELALESWGIARSVRGVLEEVNIAPEELPHRALLQQKLREILSLIPEWTPVHEAQYRTDRERQAAEREHVLLIGGINDGLTLAGDQSYQPASLTPSGLVSITVTPASVFLTPGQTEQFVATGTFSGGGTQILQSVVWTSSNPSTAVVSNSPGSAGLVSALIAGTPVITATAGDAGGSSNLSVATLVSIAIAPASPSLQGESTQQFSATGTFSDGSTHDVTASVTWSSSNSSIVSIGNGGGSQGLASTGSTAGTATITATLGTTSASTSVTVLAIPATPSITTVSPSTGTAGTQVTISGSGFGSVQGTGTVWLGTNLGAVASWSSTQIVATISTGSQSGIAQVQQNGTSSNTVSLTISTSTISTVAPTVGVPGTQVTITGSGFGASQGTGQVWLGTQNGVVISWSDTQIVAEVATGSLSGNAQVLQNGVMSNKVPFTVDTLQITGVSPTSGAAGTYVTITGTGFGSSQGSGTVWLGSINGNVVSWSDTQIVATVASGSVSGVVKVQQNGQWSNAVTFTVPGGSVALVPDVINMLVGDTHAIEALNSSGQSVTGLTWTSSNTNVVTLSTDDPPILTAAGVGRSTITGGGASAEVTVSPALAIGLPLGTVLCSTPGDGSGIASIVPAVPSQTGVADVFAFQNDGTVVAINSDCTTAWTAQATQNSAVPDFNGGLVVANFVANNNQVLSSIVSLDGITGQPDSTYTPSGSTGLFSSVVVHPDGTIFTVQAPTNGYPNYAYSVIGIDPSSGAQKFSVPLPEPTGSLVWYFDTVAGNAIIAGDGYFYIPYWYSLRNPPPQDGLQGWYLNLLRVNSAGESDNIQVAVVPQDANGSADDTIQMNLITNADTGVIVTWSATAIQLLDRPAPTKPKDAPPVEISYGMAITTGTGVNVVSNGLNAPNIVPVLQAQDGSFFGTTPAAEYPQSNMVAFDSGGNIRWTVPNEQPQIATADGGVIGQSGTTYDGAGNATGQIANLPAYSWLGNGYVIGSVDRIMPTPLFAASSFWAFIQASQSGNRAAIKQEWFPHLDKDHYNWIYNANYDLWVRLGNPTLSALAQYKIFNVLALHGITEYNGNPLTTTNFRQYLLSGLYYNGLRSSYCVDALRNPFLGNFCNDYNILLTSIGSYLSVNAETSALTETPSNPLRTYFRPSDILSSSAGKNLGNEAMIFHEALHGFTGKFDQTLEQYLTGGTICGITPYIQTNVLMLSPGLDPTTLCY
jgi:hypothetical protein